MSLRVWHGAMNCCKVKLRNVPINHNNNSRVLNSSRLICIRCKDVTIYVNALRSLSVTNLGGYSIFMLMSSGRIDIAPRGVRRRHKKMSRLGRSRHKAACCIENATLAPRSMECIER